MNPRRYIEDLCRRYGVSATFGLRLQPLVERAGQVEPEKRRRLLELVDRSFEQEARRLVECIGEDRPRYRLTKSDRKTLASVASILHQWNPPGWLKGWEEGKTG